MKQDPARRVGSSELLGSQRFSSVAEDMVWLSYGVSVGKTGGVPPGHPWRAGMGVFFRLSLGMTSAASYEL